MNLLEKAKNNKIITAIIGVMAIFLIFISIGMASRSSTEEVVNNFETALLKGDIDTLQKLVEPEDKDMEITDDHLQQLVSYTKDESEYLKAHIFLLKAQAAINEKNGSTMVQNPLFNEYTEGEIKNLGDFYLKKSEGLFSSYKVYARPYYLEVSTNEPDAVIKLKGYDDFKTKEGSLAKTYGPLMPGTYTITGSKKYKYANVTAKEEINLFNDDERKDSVELNLTGEKITVESSVENVEVFLNGKSTGEKASVYKVVNGFLGSEKKNEEEKQFGPLSTDGSIKIHGEVKYPWGTSKSEPQNVEKDTESIDVTPSPFVTKESRDNVMQTINDYARQRIQALVQQKPSIITTASDNIVKQFTEDIENDKFLKNYWKGEALGTRIDFGKVTLTQEDEQYQAKIPVEFHNKAKEYKGYNDDEPLEEEFIELNLTLDYDQKSNKWIISNSEPINFSDDDFMTGKDVVKSQFK
ncbi:hypothetical protein [Alkalihalobacillus sp. TS-13]|uniref:TcaA 3rd/4th domain-containing protein n=1 Tax=Alkalihalobacillus sp. TS-13 TaxID=2842455 RepID=UPI001C867360|nr:hypothetical protein [Alkalihalobacillus sp. TS-13]